MKFRAVAIPDVDPGIDYSEVKVEVVPNQALSLREILTRFSRGESMDVGFSGRFGGEDADTDESVDLEKLRDFDLVEKEDFVKKQKEVAAKFEAQENRKKAMAEKKAAEEKAAADEERIEKEVEKRSRGRTKDSSDGDESA